MSKKEAFEFLASLRGQYIVSQALCYAIEELKKVPAPFTEKSNIADMEYLRDNAFPMFRIFQSAEKEAK